MASAPPAANLPLFYRDLMPLNSRDHASWKSRSTDKAPWLATIHAIPLTVEEFPSAQRFTPIIFSADENPVPLALMGLNDGVNVFTDESGQLTTNVYVPAYVRRYPFMLAQLTETTDQLSLCFDPTAEAIGNFEDGEALFDGENPSQSTSDILAFCEQFEQAGQRTGAFVAELKGMGLLMDGAVAIQPENSDKPFVYRGFQMVDEAKFRELRGDELRKMNQSGSLALVMAHLFSLALVRDIFARHVAQGSGPQGFNPLGGDASAQNGGGDAAKGNGSGESASAKA